MDSDRRTHRLRALGACAACAAALSTTPASTVRAEQPTEVSPSDRDTARGLMRSGDAKAAVGDTAGALEDYRLADRIMGVATTRLAVGTTLAQMGKLVEARDVLMSVRGIPAAADEPSVLAEARAEAARLAAELADRIPTVSFRPSNVPDPAAVEVLIDGRAVPAGTATAARKIDPGEHRVIARAEGFEPIELDIALDEGETQAVDLPFLPAEPEATEGAGEPFVPGGEGPGGGATTAASEGDEAASSGLSPVAWVGFGLAGAGLVIGVVGGAIASSRASDLKDQCPDDQCPRSETEDSYDSTFAAAHASTAGFIIAGAGLALGLIGLVLPGPEPETTSPEQASVEPWIGLGGAGISGRF